MGRRHTSACYAIVCLSLFPQYTFTMTLCDVSSPQGDFCVLHISQVQLRGRQAGITTSNFWIPAVSPRDIAGVKVLGQSWERHAPTWSAQSTR